MIPELFPEIDFDAQRKLMAAATELWRRHDAVLDTMSACVRFEIPPRECNIIINFVVCSHRAGCYTSTRKEPKLNDQELFNFILSEVVI